MNKKQVLFTLLLFLPAGLIAATSSSGDVVNQASIGAPFAGFSSDASGAVRNAVGPTARFIAPFSDGTPTSSHPVDAALLAGPLPNQALPRPTSPPPVGLGTLWTADLLRWRLARPGARYVLHLRDDVTFVSTTTLHGRLRVAVLLKVLARQETVKPVALRDLAATLARYHRTPLILYWGVNPLVQGGGVLLPRRLMPSPLGLVLHPFDDDGVPRIDVDSIDVTSFEFLDFDAY